ncbi:endonuclease [Archangium lansingense]|uniref:Endonuclease n=1 Tax=Archangium lansingense TaxID=2995310 RepID=A0ABT4AEY2_9BACT|nr:endonuclease [Archangium lansinium]MCY1080252.1 endonuclease [Archangium lansinium]
MKTRKNQGSHRMLPAVVALMLGSQVWAYDAYYSNNPTAWYNEVAEDEYFNPSLTPGWQLNETCSDTGYFSVASYNIFHNVPFVYDFGDEMEQSLGKVTKCADVVLYQEAWDYDDIIEDGPKQNMASRGFSTLTPSGYYCDDTWGGIENDCSGLMIFYKSGTTLVREFTLQPFTDVNGTDVHKEKGVWGAIFAKGGKYYYVFDTHFTYGNKGHLEGDAASDASRTSNMKQSLAYIRNQVNANKVSYPPSLILFGGDFNADFASNNSYSRGYQLLVQAAAQTSFYEPYDYSLMSAVLGSYETPGFQSNWVGGAVDTGPNGMASGEKADYDTLLLGQPGAFGGCSPAEISYSGWAPAWKTTTGVRKWPFYTHSDHYGRWIRVKPGC